jgi:hypothetical protein
MKLLTGATGVAGAFIANEFVKEREPVRILVRSRAKFPGGCGARHERRSCDAIGRLPGARAKELPAGGGAGSTFHADQATSARKSGVIGGLATYPYPQEMTVSAFSFCGVPSRPSTTYCSLRGTAALYSLFAFTSWTT